MSKTQSWVALVFGVFILCITHSSIRSGEIPLRWSDQKVTLTDPNFWFYAGSFFGFGLVMVLSSTIYLATENRYLPNMNTKDGIESAVYAFVIVFVVGILGIVLKGILPRIYL